MTPAELARSTGFRLNHVSMYLTEMKEAGLINCLNEDSKKGRLYQLTDLGKKTIKYL